MENEKHTILSEALIIQVIMNYSQDTFYFKDKDSKFLGNSKAHAIQFGVEDPKLLVGKSDFDFFTADFAEMARADEIKIMETGIPIIGKVERVTNSSNEVVWYSSSKYPLYDLNGNIIGTWGSSRDITSLKKVEEELEYVNKQLEKANTQLKELSNIDGLSGVYNHRYFCETAEDIFNLYRNKARKEHKTFCVMLLDVDCFKKINDTYGHLIGDVAIKHIADLLISNTRSKDLCFRYGGDEFAILLLDTDYKQGVKLAERIRVIIEESPARSNELDFQMTVSIGISCYQGEKDINTLIQKADSQLYISKQNGKNQVN
jgi:PAS domain S-box/diguanylate cyclase (GGDEF) domain